MATHRLFLLAALAAVPLGMSAASGASATNAPAWSGNAATSRALLVQAPGGATSQGPHPRAPHLDNQPGDSPVPHNPAGSPNRADGGGAAAHLHVQGGGDVSSHRPGAGPSAAGGVGAAAHLDNQPGDTPTPHRPGRGTP